jgi:hypothetical protein
VQYGSGGRLFTAVNCSAVGPTAQDEALQQVQCLSAPGVGMNLTWTVMVRGQVSQPFVQPGSPAATASGVSASRWVRGALIACPLVGTRSVGCPVQRRCTTPGDRKPCRCPCCCLPPCSCRYIPPTLSSVAPSVPLLSTRGRQTVVLRGSNLGPAGYEREGGLTVTYGPLAEDGRRYIARNCVVDPGQPHAVVTCTTVSGVGSGHVWRITVGGQEALPSLVTTAYVH